jgi:hypothetical protein
MKTKIFFMQVLFLAIIAITSTVNAQTRQYELVADFGEIYIQCLDRTIDGTWTAHFTYFLGKDGKIERLHINTWKSDFHDINTGEEVKILDTFNDSYGSYFWFMNNPNAANGSPSEEPLIYNVGDGWLDKYMPEDYPFEEGTMVEMNWKFLIKGAKFGISTLIQLHQNAHGELTATVEKSKVICTE